MMLCFILENFGEIPMIWVARLSFLQYSVPVRGFFLKLLQMLLPLPGVFFCFFFIYFLKFVRSSFNNLETIYDLNEYHLDGPMLSDFKLEGPILIRHGDGAWTWGCVWIWIWGWHFASAGVGLDIEARLRIGIARDSVLGTVMHFFGHYQKIVFWTWGIGWVWAEAGDENCYDAITGMNMVLLKGSYICPNGISLLQKQFFSGPIFSGVISSDSISSFGRFFFASALFKDCVYIV